MKPMKILSKVPVNHRILLHLHALSRYRDHFELPFSLTQMGIAQELGVHRAAVARGLGELKGQDLVLDETRHVIRGNRKRKVYFLTPQGIDTVKELEENLLEAEVLVREGEGEVGHPCGLRTLLGKKQDAAGLLALVSQMKGGVLDAATEESIAQGRKGGRRPVKEQRLLFSGTIPKTPHFTGRSKELLKLTEQIQEGRVFALVLQGLAGIGKTSLAARVAEECQGKRDVLWLEIHPWTGLGSFVSALLSPFQDAQAAGSKHQGDGLPAKADDAFAFEAFLERALALLSRREALVVLDDLQNAGEHILEFLGALFKGMRNGTKSCFLITTRTMPNFYDRRLVSPGKLVVELSLTGLSFQEAFSLMNTLSSRNSRDKSLLQDQGRDQIFPELELPEKGEASAPFLPDQELFQKRYQETQGHPFALELLSSMGVSSAKLDFERFIGEEIFTSLSDEEKGILFFASVFRLPLQREAFLASIPEGRASTKELELLQKKSLLRETSGLLSLHALVKDFAAGRLSREEAKSYHLAAANYYLWLLAGMEESWLAGEQEAEGFRDLFGGEHPLMVQRIHHLLEAGESKEAGNLILDSSDEFISCGNVEFYELLQGLQVNQMPGEQQEEFLSIIGDAHTEFGRLDKALESYKKRLSQSENGSLEEAAVLRKMGDLEGKKGDLARSIKLKEQSLAILTKRKDQREMARLHNELGLDFWKQGELEKAQEAFSEALKISSAPARRRERARILLNLAQLEAELGESAAARVHLKECLATDGSDEERMEVQHLLGDMALQEGKKDEAVRYYKMGFVLARGIREFREMMFYLEQLGRLLFEDEKTLEFLSGGLAFIEEETGGSERQLHAHHRVFSLSRLPPWLRRKAAPQAASLSKEREAGEMRLTRSQGVVRDDNYRFAGLCRHTALLAGKLDRSVKAREYLSKAAAIYSAFGDLDQAASLHLEMGSLRLSSGELKEAAGDYKQAFLFFEQQHNSKGCAISLLNFAGVLEQLANDKEARERLVQIYRKAAEISLEADFEKGAGIADRKLQELEKK